MKKVKHIVEFPSKFLLEELNLPCNAIEDEIIDTSRWSIHHQIIFEHEGKFYSASYSEGATEYQDEAPWQYYDTVTCYEVEQKEVLVKKWVNKE